jgi:hypothetical protein
MHEIWTHIYNPEAREQCKEWRHSSSQCLKKLKTQKSPRKVLAIVLWDRDGIVLGDRLEKGATIMVKYYVPHLDKLKQQLVEASF